MSLGISIYPTKENTEEIIEYIKFCRKYNVKRIFTNLLECNEEKQIIIDRYKKINQVAHDNNMYVIIDVSPSVFDYFDINYDDLSFFNDLEVDGLRLDEGFDGSEEARMTKNKYNLKIEINASQYNSYINQIIDNDPNLNNLITCHNFYPQRYTGLSFEYFEKCSIKFKNLGLRVAAFIASKDENSYGVWKESNVMTTIEEHRNYDFQTQYRHLSALKYVDDIIVSNCYATKEELEEIVLVDENKLNFKLDLEDNISDVERDIIFKHEHFVRPDLSEYMYRSTIPRITYKNSSIKENNTKRILEVGDVIIVNDNLGRYKGELHIVTKKMINDGDKNYVGKIVNEDHFLLDLMDSNKSFKFL